MYIIPRLIQYVVVVFIGITITFIIPRLTPIDPVQSAINNLTSYGGAYMEPEAVASLQNTLKELYGLEGGIVEAVLCFWKHLFTFDFGPSYPCFHTCYGDYCQLTTMDFWFVTDNNLNVLDHRKYLRRISRIF